MYEFLLKKIKKIKKISVRLCPATPNVTLKISVCRVSGCP